MLGEALSGLRSSIEEACRACGRSSTEVKLLAVSKTFPVEAVREVHALGQTDFGENYVQEARTKAPLVPSACWHMVGPLQKNKINQALEMFRYFHTLDSLELVRGLDARAVKARRIVQGLLQVHQGDEESKHGLSESSLFELLAALSAQPLVHVRLVGLMSVPPPPEPGDNNRIHFRRLRELLEQGRREYPEVLQGSELSMGMSEDYPTAIAEGATWIRIGRALFGHRELKPHS